jgi:hypothetical protein
MHEGNLEGHFQVTRRMALARLFSTMAVLRSVVVLHLPLGWIEANPNIEIPGVFTLLQNQDWFLGSTVLHDSGDLRFFSRIPHPHLLVVRCPNRQL